MEQVGGSTHFEKATKNNIAVPNKRLTTKKVWGQPLKNPKASKAHQLGKDHSGSMLSSVLSE